MNDALENVCSIETESLGFLLKVKIIVGDYEFRGKHTTYEDEDGKVLDSCPHFMRIRNGLSILELMEVASHEAYHLFYSVRHLITVDEETQAEVFGGLVKHICAYALESR